MSLFDPTVFFNSPFAETATFYADSDPETEGQDITVIVNRELPKQTTFKGADFNSVSYPLTVDIRKSDIASLTMMTNKIKVKNIEYVEKTLPLQKIVYADEYIWRVAL